MTEPATKVLTQSQWRQLPQVASRGIAILPAKQRVGANWLYHYSAVNGNGRRVVRTALVLDHDERPLT